MRKVPSALPAFVLAVIFLFSGCGKSASQKSFTPQKSFSVHMSGDKGGKLFETDIVCSSPNKIKISFTYPEELSGFTVESAEGGYDINIFGIIDSITKEELQNDSLLNILFSTLKKTVYGNEVNFSADENGFSATAVIDSIPVSVSFSEDGIIQSMSVPSIDFSAEFHLNG